jgi:hypothetical protein
LTYVTLASSKRADAGKSETEEISHEAFEVVQRIPDLTVEGSARSLGEVFVIHITGSSDTASLSRELFFSTRLGWSIGYTTDLQVTLVDWSE